MEGILYATDKIPFAETPQNKATTYLSNPLFIHHPITDAIKGKQYNNISLFRHLLSFAPHKIFQYFMPRHKYNVGMACASTFATINPSSPCLNTINMSTFMDIIIAVPSTPAIPISLTLFIPLAN